VGGKIYSLDWGHNQDKVAVYDGETIHNGLPKLKNGDIVVAENVPSKIAKKIVNSGATLLCCAPTFLADFREEIGWGKTDEMDAILIMQAYQMYPDKFRPFREDPEILALYKAYKTIQAARVQMSNRVWHKGEGIIQQIEEELEEREKDLFKKLNEELDKRRIWRDWLSKISGIGPVISAGIIGYVEKVGLDRLRYPSSLWHFAGLHVLENGVAPRFERGKKVDYNPELKKIFIGYAATSFVRQRTPPYRRLYEEEKARQLSLTFAPGELKKRYPWYKASETKLRAGHAELRARRKVAKIFALHLWLVWRAMENLPLSMPYVIEHGNHRDFIAPPYCPDDVREKILQTAESVGACVA
jgi:hypothetical protein